MIKGVWLNDEHCFRSEALYAAMHGGDVLRGHIKKNSSLPFDMSDLDALTVIGKQTIEFSDSAITPYDKNEVILILDYHHRFGINLPNDFIKCNKRMLALL